MGGGKACAELPEPEPEMACCEGPRKDWAAKACRACFRSSPVWEETERDGEKDDALIPRSARHQTTDRASMTLIMEREPWSRVSAQR